jgi:hypothetical protein
MVGVPWVGSLCFFVAFGEKATKNLFHTTLYYNKKEAFSQ